MRYILQFVVRLVFWCVCFVCECLCLCGLFSFKSRCTRAFQILCYGIVSRHAGGGTDFLTCCKYASSGIFCVFFRFAHGSMEEVRACSSKWKEGRKRKENVFMQCNPFFSVGGCFHAPDAVVSIKM